MPASPSPRRHERPYQPPLPGTASPRRRSAAGPTAGARAGASAAPDRRVLPSGASAPRRTPAPGPTHPDTAGDWRLDERTRRAGRLGVAAARAALAGVARRENAQRENAQRAHAA